jgi:hypothetical protein
MLEVIYKNGSELITKLITEQEFNWYLDNTNVIEVNVL